LKRSQLAENKTGRLRFLWPGFKFPGATSFADGRRNLKWPAIDFASRAHPSLEFLIEFPKTRRKSRRVRRGNPEFSVDSHLMPDTPVSDEVRIERERLHQKLIHVMETLGTLPHEIDWPKHWGGQRPP
jgi:hypothetical protein